jgi:hypothetical protein
MALDNVASGLCSIFFSLLCLPCLLTYKIAQIPSRRRDRSAAAKEAARVERVKARAAEVPLPLPQTRQRRLSLLPIPVDARDANGYTSRDCCFPCWPKDVLPQSQSPLFHVLPLEMRQALYQAILGGSILHIIQHGRRLVHIRCKAPPHQPCLQNSCWTYGGWDGGAAICGADGTCEGKCTGKGVSLTPILRTCRLIYTEAMSIMYATNTFSFIHLPTVLSFPPTILPARLDSIRRIEFKWHFVWPFYQKTRVPTYLHNPITPVGHDEQTWEEVWRLQRGMAGLREIRCTIMFNGCCVDAEWETRVMEALWEAGRMDDEINGSGNWNNNGKGSRGKRRMDVFRIDVPWRSQGNDWSGAPFDIVHHEPEFEGRLFGRVSSEEVGELAVC